MKVQCAHCKAVYRIADEKIPKKKTTATCKKCGAKIHIDPREKIPSKPPSLPADTSQPESPKKRFRKGYILASCVLILLVTAFIQFGLPGLTNSQVMTKPPSNSVSENRKTGNKAIRLAKHKPNPSQEEISGFQNKLDRRQSNQNSEPLLKACRKGDLETVRRLLDQGIELNPQFATGKIALVEAAKGGHIEIIKLLLEKGAKIDSVDSTEKSALMTVSESGNLAVVKFLIENGATLDASRYDGRTALIHACSKGQYDIVKILIASGSNVNYSDRDKRTPIFHAIYCGDLDLVKLLVENGADIHARTKQGDTPFIAASRGRGKIALLRYLLEQGADLNERNKLGFSPLSAACRVGEKEVIEFLLEKGADVKSASKEGTTALMVAAQKGSLETIKVLVAKKAEIHDMDRFGNTALLLSYTGTETDEKIEVIEYLLNKGANVNLKNSFGGTCLTRASSAGFPRATQILISKGAEINAARKSGQTALMLASRGGHAEVVKILLEKGAHLDIEDNMGLTALAHAANDEIRNLLKRYGAAETLINPNNFDLLHAQPYDKRLVEALRLAFNQYIRLFGAERGKTADIKVAVDQLNTRQYRITYRINLDGAEEEYGLEISNQGSEVRKNIQGLAQVLSKFASNRNYKARPLKNDSQSFSELKAEISERISHFDYIDMLKALLLVEQKVAAGKHGPGILQAAAEVYSWLAAFKSANQNQKLSDQLSTQATCCYLLGTLDTSKAPTQSFSEGLLLFALDYPAAALESFTMSSPMEHLLSAYIQYDFDKLKSLARDPKINKRLLGYLTARSYQKSNQSDVAQAYFKHIMRDYPDFLLAKEYVVRKGGVGVSRQYIRSYIVELLEKHLNLIDDFIRTDWMDYNREIEMEIRRNVPKHDMLAKWIGLHAQLVNRPNQLKQFRYLLDAELFNLLLNEDIAAALLTNFDIEARRLGRMTNASSILEMVDRIYPDSTLSKVINLQMPGNSQKAWPIVDNLSLRNADRFLLKSAMDYMRQGFPTKLSAKRFQLLKKYRKTENPNAGGLLRLTEVYKKCFYRPIVLSCLQNGISVDPYNYRFYEEILKFEESPKFIDDGKALLENHYGFLTTLARWNYKKGNIEKAIADYKQAIEIGPYQEDAYRELGDIYLEQERPKEAVNTWQEYLKYDDKSLSAVALKNRIGRAWMDNGKYTDAYQILSEAKDSWQGPALVNFAEVSEKTGKVLQAEQYYKNAAERYPTSTAPAKLGVFYLRQKNPELAYEIFRKFKNYNQYKYYYYYDLVQHYVDLNKPKMALRTIEKIDGAKKINSQYLAGVLADKKLFSLAIRELEKTLSRTIYPNTTSLLVEYNLDGEQVTADQFVEKYLRYHSRNIHRLSSFGDSLMIKGYYDNAFEFYREILEPKKSAHSSEIREQAMLKLALAWSLGSRDPSRNSEIKSHLEQFTDNTWLKSRVSFLTGEIKNQTIFEMADSSSKRGELYYYSGVYDYIDGKNDQALKKLLISLESMQWRQNGYDHAYTLAKKLAE